MLKSVPSQTLKALVLLANEDNSCILQLVSVKSVASISNFGSFSSSVGFWNFKCGRFNILFPMLYIILYYSYYYLYSII